VLQSNHLCHQVKHSLTHSHTGCAAHTPPCCRHLPNGLVPGPLLYIAAGSADLFVTTTAALELEAYKYSNLVAAAGDKQEPGECFGCGSRHSCPALPFISAPGKSPSCPAFPLCSTS
jgi:hypothetical protein